MVVAAEAVCLTEPNNIRHLVSLNQINKSSHNPDRGHSKEIDGIGPIDAIPSIKIGHRANFNDGYQIVCGMFQSGSKPKKRLREITTFLIFG